MRQWFLAGLFLTSSFSAQADSLAQVFDEALMHDPTYRSVEASYLANKEVFPQALSQMLPTVIGSASSTGTHSGFSSLGGHNVQSQTLTLSQPILHFNHWAQLAKSRVQLKQATATYEAGLQDLMIRSAQKYFDVLSAQDDLSFSRSQKLTFSRHLDQTQHRFDVGLIAITDVHDAKARYDNAVAKEIASENGLADQIEKLREITGMLSVDFTPLPKEGVPLLNPDPDDIEQWVNAAIESNLELRASWFAKQAAKDELWRQRSGHMPYLDLDASLKRGNSTPPLNNTVDTKSVSLTLTLPILQGGAVLSKTRETHALYNKSSHDYDRIYKAVTSQARRSYRGILTDISSVTSLGQAVKSNRSALDATQAAYEVGTRTIVDVLDAQTDYLSAERDKSKAYYAYLMELLRLKQAAGILIVDDLYQISGWLTKDFSH